MKKSFIFVIALGLFVFAKPAFATIYEFQPNPVDLFDLDHHYYYFAGLNWAVPAGEEVTGITLGINNINNWDNNPNILYIHLLEAMAPGIHSVYDAQQGGDNIAAWAQNNSIADVLLDTYIDNDGGSGGDIIDYTYSFSASDIAFFNSFAADGNFGFGFDPDCHFWNDGLYLTIETRTIPEPATMFLFGTGLLGAFFRRKFV